MRYLQMRIVLCCAIVLLAAGQILSAATSVMTTSFMEPFRLVESSSSEPRSIFTIRLDLHLYRDVGLRHYHVSELKTNHFDLRELEYQLRYDRNARSFLHLGTAVGDEHGFAVGFPISTDWGPWNRQQFALLTVHPPTENVHERANVPTIVMHGYAFAEDHDGIDIEATLSRTFRQPDVQAAAGDVLSIRGVFEELLDHHIVLV